MTDPTEQDLRRIAHHLTEVHFGMAISGEPHPEPEPPTTSGTARWAGRTVRG